VPANPEALALAKSLNVSSHELIKLFPDLSGRPVRALSRKTKTGLALAKASKLIKHIEKVQSCPN
jgi:hypothetical protein